MNILYIAYSCEPYKGSEDKIGWNIPLKTSETNNVFVITKAEHKEPINRWLSAHVISNVHFYFVDIPSIYKKIFKGFLYSGRLNIWNRRAYKLAKKLCGENDIEVIHQITPIEFRSIGSYGKIPNIKFVCGPIGGAEIVPVALKDYCNGHRLVECIRTTVNGWHRFKLKATKKLKKCDYVMYANQETLDFLFFGGQKQSVITEIAIEAESIKYNQRKLKIN